MAVVGEELAVVEGVEFAKVGSVVPDAASGNLKGQQGVAAAAVASVVAVGRYVRGHSSGSPAQKEDQNPCLPSEGIPWEARASLSWGAHCKGSDQTMERWGGKVGGMGCLRAVDLVEGSSLEERSSTKPLANTFTGTIKKRTAKK